jgi:hypothetical protein
MTRPPRRGYAIEDPQGRIVPGTFTTRRFWYYDALARVYPKELEESLDCFNDPAAVKRLKRRGFRLVKVERSGRSVRRNG